MRSPARKTTTLPRQISISPTRQQVAWIKSFAKQRGISLAEAFRRKLDDLMQIEQDAARQQLRSARPTT